MIAFDIGTYTGDTTDNLLKTYDKVICVDANPRMIDILKNKYKNNNSVEIIEGCITHSSDEETFYISHMDIWCSINQEIAERFNESIETIKVQPINIVDLIDKYGCPHYLKCDIEGADIVLLEQLEKSKCIPTFISCESECIGNRNIDLSKDEDLIVLNQMRKLGYNQFTLINQRYNTINETNEIFNKFDFKSLEKHWVDYDKIKTLIRTIDRNIYKTYSFWFDIIATKQ